MNPQHSLRRLLLLWLLPPVLIMLALSMIGDYVLAIRPATEAYDQSLRDTALILEAHIVQGRDGTLSLKLSGDAETVLRTDQYDQLYYAIYDGDGRLLAGTMGLNPIATHVYPRGGQFYDINWQHKELRLLMQPALVAGHHLLIQVAETTNKRKELSGRIIFGMFLPELLTVFSIIVVVWIGVGRGLAPLEKLRRLVTDAEQQNLKQLPEAQAPSELYNLVHIHNVQAEQLSEALKMQERFITNAAHQLRTPMAGLQTQSELALRLIDQEAPRTELRRHIVNIHEAAVRAARLVQQLLGLARSSACADVFSTCDLAVCAEHVANRFMDRAVAADIDLGLELEDATVSGIPTLLEEMLANLLDNALRYCPRRSCVTIRTGRDHGQCLVLIEDDGPGIPSGEQERIFERFYRLNTDKQGAGLGLAIVKEIAALHGANIQVQTGSSGRGLCIAIRFPGGSQRAQMAPRL